MASKTQSDGGPLSRSAPTLHCTTEATENSEANRRADAHPLVGGVEHTRVVDGVQAIARPQRALLQLQMQSPSPISNYGPVREAACASNSTRQTNEKMAVRVSVGSSALAPRRLAPARRRCARTRRCARAPRSPRRSCRRPTSTRDRRAVHTWPLAAFSSLHAAHHVITAWLHNVRHRSTFRPVQMRVLVEARNLSSGI